MVQWPFRRTGSGACPRLAASSGAAPCLRSLLWLGTRQAVALRAGTERALIGRLALYDAPLGGYYDTPLGVLCALCLCFDFLKIIQNLRFKVLFYDSHSAKYIDK